MGAEAEDGDLTAGLGLEVVGAGCGDEDAVIGIDAGLNVEAMVFDQEADVAQSVIFALSGRAEDGDRADAFSRQVLDGLGLIVGLLIGVQVEDRGIFSLVFLAEGIAVADNPVRDAA